MAEKLEKWQLSAIKLYFVINVLNDKTIFLSAQSCRILHDFSQLRLAAKYQVIFCTISQDK